MLRKIWRVTECTYRDPRYVNVSDQSSILTHETRMLISINWEGFFSQHLITMVKFHWIMCNYGADQSCDIWMCLFSSCFFVFHQFIFLSLWFHYDYFEHNWFLSAITWYVHDPRQEKQIWHFNLIFQVTCVGQFSQLLWCFFLGVPWKNCHWLFAPIFFLTSPHV